MAQILECFTVLRLLTSETFLNGVTFNALYLSRITYPIKVKLVYLVTFLSKGPMSLKFLNIFRQVPGWSRKMAGPELMGFMRYKWAINIWWLVRGESAVYLGRHPGQSGRQLTQLGIISSRSREQQASMSWPETELRHQNKAAYKGINKDVECGAVQKNNGWGCGLRVLLGENSQWGILFSRGSGIWGKGSMEEWLELFGG